MSHGDLPGTPTLGALYGAFFAAGGAWGPYLGLWLRDAGFDGAQIGALFSAMALTRVAGGPAGAWVADRIDRGPPVLVASLGAAAVLSGAALATPTTALVGTLLLAATFVRAPAPALIDSLVVRVLERRGEDGRGYGAIRVWGSFGYLGAGLLAGWLADVDSVLPLILGATCWGLACLIASRLLGTGLAAGGGPIALRLRGDVTIRALLLSAVVYGVGLNAYDAYYALLLEDAGLPARWTGLGLAAGISAEILVLRAAPRILGTWSPRHVVTLGMGVGVVRLALSAWVASPWTLSAIQGLHGLAYGLWWIGSVELIRQRVPDRVRASVQALFLTAAYGAGPLICGGLASVLLDRHGAASLMAAGAALAAVATAGFGAFSEPPST